MEADGVLDGHEEVAARLLAGLRDRAAPMVEPAGTGMDDGARGEERDKGPDAKLAGHLDEDVHASTLGDGGHEGELGGGHAVDRKVFEDLEACRGAGDLDETGDVFAGGAVEEDNGLADLDAVNVENVVGLGALEDDVVSGDGVLGEETTHGVSLRTAVKDI